jgi:hypothetical protein
MGSVFHKLKAYLYKNLFTPDTNDYIAKGISERSLDVREICQSAVTRGQAQTTPESMEYNVNLFLEEMGYLLCDGYSVNTGYFRAANVIRGTFNNPQEKFNKKKHSVFFNFKQGQKLKNKAENIDVEILGVAAEPNFIARVIDVKTGSVNNLLTPDGTLRIEGLRIKIFGESDEVGIYFIDQTSANIIKVTSSDIVINYPTELYVVIPQLTPGIYNLEVKTQFTGSFPLKVPRTLSFQNNLTVQ